MKCTERVEDIKSQIYEYVFDMLDCEDDMTGDLAGEIAHNVCETFVAEMQRLGMNGECAYCNSRVNLKACNYCGIDTCIDHRQGDPASCCDCTKNAQQRLE